VFKTQLEEDRRKGRLRMSKNVLKNYASCTNKLSLAFTNKLH